MTVTLTVSDAEGDPLAVTTSTPSQGRVKVVDNGNGTWNLTYNPTDAARLHAGHTSGVDNDSFTITLSDGLGGTTSLPTTAVSVSPAKAAVTTTIPVSAVPWGVAVSPDGSRTYVTNRDANTVSVIDTDTGNVIASVPDISSPMGIAVTPDGSRVYVTSVNRVAAIDAATNTLITNNIGVSSYPYAIAVSPNGKEAYVACNGQVAIIDIDPASAHDNQMIAWIYGVGASPTAVVFTPDANQAYLVNYGSNSVSVINTANRYVTKTVTVGTFPTAVAVSPDGTRAYVSNGNSTVSVINTATNTVVDTISLGSGGGANGVAVSPDGTLLYVTRDTTVSVLDVATKTVVATVPVGTAPMGVAVGSDGAASVANRGSNTASVISLVTMAGV